MYRIHSPAGWLSTVYDISEQLKIPKARGLIDAFVYEYFPLIPRDKVDVWLRMHAPHEREWILATLPDYIHALSLRDRIVSARLYREGKCGSSFDVEEKIQQVMEETYLAFSLALRLADTNWSDWELAIVTHPMTREVSIWRVTRHGRKGFPMEWQQWLSKDNTVPWIVFRSPSEYGEYAEVKGLRL
jgi:hypothetical protein